MAPTTPEDDFQLLYYHLKLSGAKARTADVAKLMGIKTNTAGMRFTALMKKLENQFGPVDGAASGDSREPTSSPANKEAKRKAGNDGEGGSPSKKGKAGGKAKVDGEA